MSLSLRIPNAVPLPWPSSLAQIIAPCGGFNEEILKNGFRVGTVVNVVNSTLDNNFVYVVAYDGQNTCETWMSSNLLKLLDPAEYTSVSSSNILPFREMLRRTTIVCADEDWQDVEQPSTLTLRAGELLQLGMVKDNWGCGWSMECHSRRGWFPLALVHRMESTLSSLVRNAEWELSPVAATALVELLKATPPPLPMKWSWEGELPTLVAQSMEVGQKKWMESFEEMEAATKETGEEKAEAVAQAESLDAIFSNNMPEDSYPLAVCKTQFIPAGHAKECLLTIKCGDLIRIMSLPDAMMVHGFIEGNPQEHGWFPKKNVKILEDPYAVEPENVPAPVGAPPLPKVPPNLRRARAGGFS